MDTEDTSDGVPVLDVLPQTLVGCTQYQLTLVWDSNAIFCRPKAIQMCL